MPKGFTSKTTVIDKGANNIEAEIKKIARRPFVKVGLIGTERHEDSKVTVTAVGAAHEFGTSKIPQRSWLRSTYDVKHGAWFNKTKQLFSKIMIGKLRTETALDVMGLLIVSDIKRKIKAGDSSWPPLADSTIEAKGSSRPLIDTGQFINSVISKRVGI